MKIDKPSGFRRILAFGVDWLVIALYGLALFGVASLIYGGVPEVSAPYNSASAQLVGFIALTLPVVSYFIYAEYRFGQTLGKRLLGLTVLTKARNDSRFTRIVVRNVFKFLPWELAHYTVHQFTAANLSHQTPNASVYAVLITLYALAGAYLVGLFWFNGRPLYDRIAGTRVISAK